MIVNVEQSSFSGVVLNVSRLVGIKVQCTITGPCLWVVSQASQAFSIAHCTNSEYLLADSPTAATITL